MEDVEHGNGREAGKEMTLPYPVPSLDIPTDSECLTVKYTPRRGRGVFAVHAIPFGRTIHTSPIILFDEADIVGTPLMHYTYVYPGHRQALALGLGSLFNHAERCNVGWYMDKGEGYITYRTSRDVQAGEELCIHYGATDWIPAIDEDRGHGQEQDEEDNSAEDLMRIEL